MANEIEQKNKFGLSKKTNVAIAGISGITLICNVQNIVSVLIGVIAVSAIALYHLRKQGTIDLKKLTD